MCRRNFNPQLIPFEVCRTLLGPSFSLFTQFSVYLPWESVFLPDITHRGVNDSISHLFSRDYELNYTEKSAPHSPRTFQILNMFSPQTLPALSRVLPPGRPAVTWGVKPRALVTGLTGKTNIFVSLFHFCGMRLF